ncbi:MAG: type II toxin-antitoxin system RelE family toxin [Jatrophihabitans sp.]
MGVGDILASPSGWEWLWLARDGPGTPPAREVRVVGGGLAPDDAERGQRAELGQQPQDLRCPDRVGRRRSSTSPRCRGNAQAPGLCARRSRRRVGEPLRGELSGIWAARRGTYRVPYRLNEGQREVIVVRVDHRRDAYRPR